MAEPWSRVYCLDWQNINLLAKNDIFSEKNVTLDVTHCVQKVCHIKCDNFDPFIDCFRADKLNNADSKPVFFH